MEQRRVRFSSIDGIDRADLPLACEIWLHDLFSASWVTREAMKLGSHLARYICRPEASTLNVMDIESHCQLNHEEVRKALSLMRSFGAAENFLCDRVDVKAALTLTVLQRLKVLETKHRFAMLARADSVRPWISPKEKWRLPEDDTGALRPVLPS